MSTGIITSDTSVDHLTGNGHPEKPDRVTSIINYLKKINEFNYSTQELFDVKFVPLL